MNKKKSDQKSRENAIEKINKLSKSNKNNTQIKVQKNISKKLKKSTIKHPSKTIPQKNMQKKNENIRKKIIKKELKKDKILPIKKDKKIMNKKLKKDKKTPEIKKNIKNKKKDKIKFHKNKKIDKKIDKKINRDNKIYNKKSKSTAAMSQRLPLIKNQSGGLGGIGVALFDMFVSVPPVFVNFYDLASNMGNEFSSLQKLPDQLKNASQAQPGQPLAKT